MSILKQPVLILNKAWYPIKLKRLDSVIKRAMCNQISFMEEKESVVYSWDEWNYTFNKQEPDDLFKYVNCGKFYLRVPEIAVCTNYNKVPKTKIRLNRRNILLRDNFTCQYTGKRLNSNELNIDHVIPSSKGGKTSWDNLVACDWRINAKKGNKTLEESGLKLIRKPTLPQWSPLFEYFNFRTKNMPESWKKFIKTDVWNEYGYWDVELKD